MKKLYLILAICILSSCSFKQSKELDLTSEMSMAHLKPIEICASEMDIEYKGFPNELEKLVRDWSTNVVKLDKSCENKAIFKMNAVYFSRKAEASRTIYQDYIDAELIMNYMTGEQAIAKARSENSIKMDADLTLYQKEKYKRDLHEQTLNTFDKVMKESIKKYIK